MKITRRPADHFDLLFSHEGKEYVVKAWLPDKESVWIDEIIRTGPGPRVELDRDSEDLDMQAAEEIFWREGLPKLEAILKPDWEEKDNQEALKEIERRHTSEIAKRTGDGAEYVAALFRHAEDCPACAQAYELNPAQQKLKRKLMR